MLVLKCNPALYVQVPNKHKVDLTEKTNAMTVTRARWCSLLMLFVIISFTETATSVPPSQSPVSLGAETRGGSDRA